MNTPLWVGELAEAFWAEAGAAEPFPRSLRKAAEWAFPLTVVGLRGLRLHAALDWLRRSQVACGAAEPDRPLRACLVARGGGGTVFVDEGDPPEEQRFSLAHELAHFLRDYWRPRRRAVERLGPAVLEVLDGLRPPRPGERLGGLLRNVRVGAFTHFLSRDRDGRRTPEVERAERDADRLAWELLAPADAVRADGVPRAELTRRLVGEFGLPQEQAERYAADLLPPPPRTPPLLLRLRRRPKNDVELRPEGGN
jgi:hypothetical protein